MNIISIRGEDAISNINSYRAWRKLTGKNNFLDIKPHLDETLTCLDCEGMEFINEKTFGKITCMCIMKQKEQRLVRVRDLYESVYEKQTLDNYIPWGSYDNSKHVKQLKADVLKWIDNPEDWLVLTGTNGCGKSHVLHSINTLLSPWSLYLSFPDLEQLYFNAIKEEDELQNLIELISSHPILLLDDMGADYGSKFARSISQKILDYRYRLYHEFPTVIATNLGPTDLKSYDPRLGDRIYDTSKNIILALHIESFRKDGIKGMK